MTPLQMHFRGEGAQRGEGEAYRNSIEERISENLSHTTFLYELYALNDSYDSYDLYDSYASYDLHDSYDSYAPYRPVLLRC